MTYTTVCYMSACLGAEVSFLMISVVFNSVLFVAAGGGGYTGDSVFKPGGPDFSRRCFEQSN